MSTTPPPPPPPPPGSYGTPAAGGGPALQNGPGTTALVTGILSLFVCPVILSIVAIVQGNKGEQLAAQGLANNGDMAKWGSRSRSRAPCQFPRPLFSACLGRRKR